MKNLPFIISLIILITGCGYQNQVNDSSHKEGKDQLLVLQNDDPECTQSPIQEEDAIGGTRMVYPVHERYQTTADDFHNISGLFTAAACGEERLNELFGSKEFVDMAIFTQNPTDELVAYLKQNNFTCSKKNPEKSCSRWYNQGPVSLEIMTGLRRWSEIIYGSDCRHCG
jgi:hypothetical protein